MKARTLVCLLAAGSLGLSSLAFAQPGNNHRDNDRRDGQRGDQRHDNRNDGRGHGRNDNRHDNRHDGRNDARGHDRQDTYYYGARGPEWRRGGRLPQTYRSNQYVVNNWHQHRLNAPPRGYHWVQVGNDYVLAAIATGIIAQLLLNN